MRKRNRVKALAVWRLVIVATAANGRKPCTMIHSNRRIAVADFKVDPRYSIVSRPFKEFIK